MLQHVAKQLSAAAGAAAAATSVKSSRQRTVDIVARQTRGGSTFACLGQRLESEIAGAAATQLRARRGGRKGPVASRQRSPALDADAGALRRNSKS